MVWFTPYKMCKIFLQRNYIWFWKIYNFSYRISIVSNNFLSHPPENKPMHIYKRVTFHILLQICHGCLTQHVILHSIFLKIHALNYNHLEIYLSILYTFVFCFCFHFAFAPISWMFFLIISKSILNFPHCHWDSNRIGCVLLSCDPFPGIWGGKTYRYKPTVNINDTKPETYINYL